jgi:SNF2 family DNA or RNA helicase
MSSELLPPELPSDAASETPVMLRSHPLAMSRTELLEFLKSLQAAQQLCLPESVQHLSATAKADQTRKRPAPKSASDAASAHWELQVLAIPSDLLPSESGMGVSVVLPQHSAAEPSPDHLLYPWQVEGIWLNPTEALVLLNSLPLGVVSGEESFVGSDLRFWSHVARWSLNLLARSKFLPVLEPAPAGASQPYLAHWQPLLDSGIDQARLTQFEQRMPDVCRAYLSQSLEQPPVAVGLPTPPQTLLQGFLSRTIDAQIRAVLSGQPLPSPEKGRKSEPIEAPVRLWLQALTQPTSGIANPEVATLAPALTTWMAPLQNRGFEQNLFRTCFCLHPPRSGETQWLLEFFLQAVDDPEFLVSAPTIWGNPVEHLNYRGRTIARPQETLLAGLGLASRLYALIEPSLQAARPQFCTLTALQAYDFLKSVAWRLQDSGLGVVLPPSLAQQDGWANRLGLKIQAQTARPKMGDRLGLQSLLNFRWELSIGGQTLSKAEFDRLVALNTPLVEINGEWVELRPQDIRAAQAFFASRKDETALSLEDALRISTGDTQMIEKLPVVSFEAAGALEELINTLNGNQTIAAIATPADFRGELRPYQSRGVGWLAFLEQWGLGACLADDMGLGKTIQLIAFLLHLKAQDLLNAPTLLVCPTSVLGNWEREVKKFAPSLTVWQHHGDKRLQGKAFAKAVQFQHLVITSYALVQRDLPDLKTVTWRGIVLDEAQNIKNPEAKQSQAVRQLEAQFRIALTGTPVENRLSELWSILDFLNPGYLGPKNFFQRRFATPIERYGDTASLQTLRSLVQPFILRRLKTDRDIIQDLPAKQESTVFCGLTAEQATLYQTLVETSLTEIDAAEGIQRKGIILALLVKLKQLCNHPVLFLKPDAGSPALLELQAATFADRSGKLQRLEAMLEEVVAEGDRALIFTQFAEWGKLLKAHLERQLGRETLLLYGGTAKKQREEMVDRFQHDPQAPRIFILSLKAGGVGLNLTRANHVFHFDRWWNPAVENQATDRVFRIGQTRNVQVHKFVCNGTLEEKIHDLIESKKALAEQVVGAGENWLTDLSTDQLRDLLLLDRSAIIGAE